MWTKDCPLENFMSEVTLNNVYTCKLRYLPQKHEHITHNNLSSDLQCVYTIRLMAVGCWSLYFSILGLLNCLSEDFNCIPTFSAFNSPLKNQSFGDAYKWLSRWAMLSVFLLIDFHDFLLSKLIILCEKVLCTCINRHAGLSLCLLSRFVRNFIMIISCLNYAL